MNIVGLKCVCHTNPDIDGYWSRQDVEAECQDIGISPEDWLGYLFSHLTSDYDEWTAEIENAFVNNDCVASIEVKLGGDIVKFIKKYR